MKINLNSYGTAHTIATAVSINKKVEVIIIKEPMGAFCGFGSELE